MPDYPNIITITLNAALDRVVEVEKFSPGVYENGNTIQYAPGGKGVNVSKILAACGVPSTATAFVGTECDQVFDTLFDDETISDATLVVPGKNRENVTVIASDQATEHHIKQPGLAVEPYAFRELLEQLRGLVEPGDIAVVSSSLPEGVSEKMFADLIDLLAELEAKICVDTSGAGLTAIKRKKLWLIKPNLEEFSELTQKQFDSTEQMLKTARGLAQKYEHILLSADAQGAYLITRSCVLHAKCNLPENEYQNAVGSGDALLGAFIAAVTGGANLTEALEFATAIATATVACKYTAQFDPDFAESMLRAVKITEL